MEAKNYKITVIGAGTMGSGIAQVAASAGETVHLFDTNVAALHKAENNIKNTLQRSVDKGRISATQADSILHRISYSSALQDAQNADCVIEAIVEQLQVKKTLFAQLETLVSDHCILASNTSSLSIASIAAACSKPERVVGIHFFNPAPLMKLVEVIPAIQTQSKTLEWAVHCINKWGKTPAVVKDTPGFIVNRVARPYYSEALRMYEEGMADFATIDHAMKSLGGFKMGPFELMDFIGNDVNYAVTESVFTAFYFDPRYKPSFTQKRLSEAGYWGRKSGRGYYSYGEDALMPQAKLDEKLLKILFTRILMMLINEAAEALHFGIASAIDIDNAMKLGVNYPKGLLQWADELGIETCVKELDALYDEYREDRYRCSVILRRMAASNKTFFKMNAAEIVQKMMHHDAFSQWLGIKVEEISAGACHLSMRVRAEMLNGFGIAHGGISYALADSALAFASNAHGIQALSIDTSIQHIEAIREGDTLHAYAREESLKNKFAVYTVEIKSGGKLIALFKGTVYRTQKNWEP